MVRQEQEVLACWAEEGGVCSIVCCFYRRRGIDRKEGSELEGASKRIRGSEPWSIVGVL